MCVLNRASMQSAACAAGSNKDFEPSDGLRRLDIQQEDRRTTMSIDLNKAEPQRDRTLIPPNVYWLMIAIRRGNSGADGALKTAKNQRSLMLELDYTVVGGDHAGKKFRDWITVEYDETDDPILPPIIPERLEDFRTSVRMGLTKLRAMIDSAYALQPNDESEDACAKRRLNSYLDINGLIFCAQVDERPGSGGYDPSNIIDFVITPDLPDWPKDGPPTTSQSATSTAVARRSLVQDLNDSIPF
jgi:hypothetical protein